VNIRKQANAQTYANLVKLVNVAYEEIAIASCNLGVRNVNHILKTNTYTSGKLPV